MVQVIPQAPSLGELLGGGFSKGVEKGSEMMLKQQLSKALGLTAYQKLSTELRQKDQTRKIEGAVSSELLKLADPGLETGLMAEDVPGLSSDVTKEIEKGTDPQQALASTLESYSSQQSLLEEMDLPKFKAKNSKANQEQIISTFGENKINNSNLINRKLKGLKYPHKSRQEILKGVKSAPTAKALTPDIAQKFMKEAGNDKVKARELAKKSGYSF